MPRLSEGRPLGIERDAEVCDLHLAAAPEKNVRRFQVSVYDAARVDFLQSACQLQNDERRNPWSDELDLMQYESEVGPGYVLLRDVAQPAPGETVVHADDVLVVDGCRSLGLSLETLVGRLSFG